MSLIETPRLTLRPTGLPDRTWLRELLLDEDVRRTTLQPAASPLRAWLSAWITAATGASKETFWVIEDRLSRTPAGWITLSDLPPAVPPAMGFEIRKRHWNKGYATEAAVAVAGHWLRRPGEECVSGLVFTGNRASQRVFEKAGFALLGRTELRGPSLPLLRTTVPHRN